MKKLFFISLIYTMLVSTNWGQSSSTHQFDLKKTSDTDSSIVLTAPDNTQVTILRDSFGVPHIKAETETGVFYGEGYAIAQDRLYQLELNMHTAEGRLAEWFGPSYADADKFTLSFKVYSDSEQIQIFENLSIELQNLFTAYSKGINRYIDSINSNPEKYKPFEFTQPGIEIEPWNVYKSLEVSQFIGSRFGAAGGDELDRLKELQENGWDWFNKNRPINDSTAPTTIPDGVLPPPQNFHYSGMTVRPELIDAIDKVNVQRDAKLKSVGIPLKWGSFAAVITPSKSSTGNVMLLGCPQTERPEKDKPNNVNEVELQCPSFDVGGTTVPGMPMIIIGHNEYCAWTLTSGESDNQDMYIDSTYDASYSSYWYKGQWLPFDSFVDTIKIAGGSPEIFKHYRTIHGPIVGSDLQNHQTFSLKKTFWKEESGTMQFFYKAMKAKNLAEFEAAVKLNFLSFNIIYIDKDQNVNYWHSGKFQDRTDGVDPRLPHKGDGSEEWGGFIPFSDLPAIHNPVQGYLVNWNNKPVSWWNQGDGVPWCPYDTIFVSNNSFSLHNSYNSVLRIKEYVAPIDSFTYSNLENIPYAIQDHGTYQEAIEMSPTEIKDENILPPGQSGFIDINGVKSSHFNDQWTIFTNWQFKDQIFSSSIVGVKEKGLTTPESYKLYQNYPNPFNPTTTIKYSIPKQSLVTLKIYDILGREITTLVNKEKTAGTYKIELNASSLASGVYFYRLQAGSFVETKKMILMK